MCLLWELPHLNKYHPSKHFLGQPSSLVLQRCCPSAGTNFKNYIFENLIVTSLFIIPNASSQLDYTIHSTNLALNDLAASENKFSSKEEDLSAFKTFN